MTGLTDEDVIGRPVREVLGLDWMDEGDGGASADIDRDGETDPIETSLEWGVRSLGKRVSVDAEGDLPGKAVADLFPAYDDDGGLLLVLTPEWPRHDGFLAGNTSSSCCWSSALLVVLGAHHRDARQRSSGWTSRAAGAASTKAAERQATNSRR